MKARQKNKQKEKFEAIYFYEKEARKSCGGINPYRWFVYDEFSEFSYEQILSLNKLTKYSQEIGLYDN